MASSLASRMGSSFSEWSKGVAQKTWDDSFPMFKGALFDKSSEDKDDDEKLDYLKKSDAINDSISNNTNSLNTVGSHLESGILDELGNIHTTLSKSNEILVAMQIDTHDLVKKFSGLEQNLKLAGNSDGDSSGGKGNSPSSGGADELLDVAEGVGIGAMFKKMVPLLVGAITSPEVVGALAVAGVGATAYYIGTKADEKNKEDKEKESKVKDIFKKVYTEDELKKADEVSNKNARLDDEISDANIDPLNPSHATLTPSDPKDKNNSSNPIERQKGKIEDLNKSVIEEIDKKITATKETIASLTAMDTHLESNINSKLYNITHTESSVDETKKTEESTRTEILESLKIQKQLEDQKTSILEEQKTKMEEINGILSKIDLSNLIEQGKSEHGRSADGSLIRDSKMKGYEHGQTGDVLFTDPVGKINNPIIPSTGPSSHYAGGGGSQSHSGGHQEAPKPTLTKDQEEAFNAVQSGSLSADDPKAKALESLSPEQLAAGGIEKTEIGGHFSYSTKKITDEEAKKEIPQKGNSREVAEKYLGRKMSDDEYHQLKAATVAESGGNPKEDAMVMASILNRARGSKEGGVIDALHAPNQFQSVTGTSADGHRSSSNFTNPNPKRLSQVEENASDYLDNISHDQKNFTANSSKAYGPGTNIGYRDNMLASGGQVVGGSVFNTAAPTDKIVRPVDDKDITPEELAQGKQAVIASRKEALAGSIGKKSDTTQEAISGRKPVLLAAGTNDWDDPKKSYEGVKKSIDELKAKGYDPVLVLPRKDMTASGQKSPTSNAYDGALKAATEAGVKTEYPSGWGKGEDNYHMTSEAGKEIRDKYPGAMIIGDSNAGQGRLSAVANPNSFSGKGSSYVADKISDLPNVANSDSISESKVDRPKTPQDVIEHLSEAKRQGLITNDECVSLTAASVGVKLGDPKQGADAYASNWVGKGAPSKDTAIGTPLITTTPDGRYAAGTGGVGGIGRDHGVNLLKMDTDDKGSVKGAWVANQWNGNGFDPNNPEKNQKYIPYTGKGGEWDLASYQLAGVNDGKGGSHLLGKDNNPEQARQNEIKIAELHRTEQMKGRNSQNLDSIVKKSSEEDSYNTSKTSTLSNDTISNVKESSVTNSNLSNIMNPEKSYFDPDMTVKQDNPLVNNLVQKSKEDSYNTSKPPAPTQISSPVQAVQNNMLDNKSHHDNMLKNMRGRNVAPPDERLKELFVTQAPNGRASGSV